MRRRERGKRAADQRERQHLQRPDRQHLPQEALRGQADAQKGEPGSKPRHERNARLPAPSGPRRASPRSSGALVSRARLHLMFAVAISREARRRPRCGSAPCGAAPGTAGSVSRTPPAPGSRFEALRRPRSRTGRRPRPGLDGGAHCLVRGQFEHDPELGRGKAGRTQGRLEGRAGSRSRFAQHPVGPGEVFGCECSRPGEGMVWGDHEDEFVLGDGRACERRVVQRPSTKPSSACPARTASAASVVLPTANRIAISG